MKSRFVLLAAGLVMATAEAREVNETLEADPDGRVSVYNTAGSVQIEGWSRDAVEVTGDLGDDIEEFQFEREGNEIIVRVRTPRSEGSYSDAASDLEIRVPRNSRIEVATISADIEVAAVHGEQSLQAISGDVQTEVFESDLRVETVSGDIELTGTGADNDLKVSTVSGDVIADELAGSLVAGSVSGDIEIAGGTFERAELNTVNGEILFQSGLRDGGRLFAETVNGQIDVELTGEVSARFEISTFNGSIDNCFGPEPVRTSRYAPGWELRFTEGDGSARVELSTLNGELNLCRD